MCDCCRAPGAATSSKQDPPRGAVLDASAPLKFSAYSELCGPDHIAAKYGGRKLSQDHAATMLRVRRFQW